jgi:hypothetical protein
MKVTEYAKLIGKTAKYQVKDMIIDVEIVDVTPAGWERVSFLIRPVSGTGTCKVLESSLNFD